MTQAVRISRTRIKQKRHLGNRFCQFHCPCLAAGPGDGLPDGAGVQVVGKAGGHGHKFPECDLTGCRMLTVFQGRPFQRPLKRNKVIRNSHGCKLRNEFFHRVVQVDQARFHQLHTGSHGNDLGARINIIKVICGNRSGSVIVAPPPHPAKYDLMVLHNPAVYTGQAVLLPQSIDIGCNSLKVHWDYSFHFGICVSVLFG